MDTISKQYQVRHPVQYEVRYQVQYGARQYPLCGVQDGSSYGGGAPWES
ncbi:hypothetical protein [Streptomyces sp. Act143]|nr:hypothetical protein [Streptomyces sp. Act143]